MNENLNIEPEMKNSQERNVEAPIDKPARDRRIKALINLLNIHEQNYVARSEREANNSLFLRKEAFSTQLRRLALESFLKGNLAKGHLEWDFRGKGNKPVRDKDEKELREAISEAENWADKLIHEPSMIIKLPENLFLNGELEAELDKLKKEREEVVLKAKSMERARAGGLITAEEKDLWDNRRLLFYREALLSSLVKNRFINMDETTAYLMQEDPLYFDENQLSESIDWIKHRIDML